VLCETKGQWLRREQCFSHYFLPNIPYFWDTRSTTARAHAIDPKGFQVSLICAGFEKALPEEYSCLHLEAGSMVWVREVELHLLSAPVMFARLAVPYSAITNVFQRIPYLGNHPLGGYLFRLGGITRKPFEIKCLQKGDRFYEKLTKFQENKPLELWARRSIFTYRGENLLLTEVFLPEYVRVFGGKDRS
jgi:chorismate--pyruvate lyase